MNNMKKVDVFLHQLGLVGWVDNNEVPLGRICPKNIYDPE